jgi:signal transduction histidine kinase
VSSIAFAPVATPQRARAFTWTVGIAAAAAAAAGAIALASGAGRDQTTALAGVTLVTALSFIASGVIAWRRRPDVWTGALMVAAGFCTLAGSLADFQTAVPFTIGLVIQPLPAAIICHLVLAFPEGRLHSTSERIVVGGAYFVSVVLQVVMLMFMGFGNVAGCPCPSNLLLVRDDMSLHAAIMTSQRAVGIFVALGAAWIMLRRWQLASPPLRRALAPIMLTGGVTAVLLGVALIAQQFSTPAWAAVSAVERVAIATVPLAYLLALFRARLGRVAVSDLVVELGRTPEPGRLRDALARSLHDPSLELAYWVPEAHGYVGIDGRPVDPGAAGAGTGPGSRAAAGAGTGPGGGAGAGAGRTVTVLERHGERIAALVHDPALAEDPALLEAVSAAAGLALENERLLAELRAQLEQLRLSRARIVEAGDTERRRLERNLHDGAQQRLVSLALGLGLAESKVGSDPEAAMSLLAGAREELTLALGELRELARGIHPAVLTERGLSYALTGLAERAGFEVALDVELDGRPPPPVEAAAYYVVAESLANIGKYAQATRAQVRVGLRDGDRLVVEIADDGVGGADPSAGSGLRGLDDRVQAFGGSLRVISPPGEGTRIVAELPLRP